MGCRALLQGIFRTQASSPGLPHCRQIRYHLSHWGLALESPLCGQFCPPAQHPVGLHCHISFVQNGAQKGLKEKEQRLEVTVWMAAR